MAKAEQITEPTRGTYKGSPTLSVPKGNGYGFTFGVAKARAILQHIDAIKAFVAECGGDEKGGE